MHEVIISLQDTKELERRLSEASLANDSGSTVNVLSTEYDTLSLQVKAVRVFLAIEYLIINFVILRFCRTSL